MHVAASRTDKQIDTVWGHTEDQLGKTTSELLLGSQGHCSGFGFHGHMGSFYSDMLSYVLPYPKTARESGEQLPPGLVRTSVFAAGYAQGV
jgi:hypothetical protein